MTEKSRGYVYVAIQFLLIGLIVLIPAEQPAEVFNYVGGVLFIAPGLIILFLALKNLGRSLDANPVPKHDGALIETGMYRYLRHPIYTGVLLATLGTVIQSASWFKFLLWVALLVLLNLKAAFEERLLAAKYPGYRAYQSRTGRFLPRIGK